MEKKESRGIIGNQLNPQKIIENLVNEKKVDSVFLSKMVEKAKTFENITFIPLKQFVTPKLIKPGMYAYADSLIYPKFIPEAQLQSIVGYVDEKQILAWCLRSKILQWSKEYFLAGTKDKTLSGKEATRRIITEGNRLDIETPAADYSFNYAEDGVTPETAFMPSYNEGKLLLSGDAEVNQALDVAGLPRLETLLFLSSEYDSYIAWILRPCVGASFGGLDIYVNKNYNFSVRPVLDLSYLLK